MIEPEKRKAIYYLYLQGMPIKQIARSLQVDKKTVHTIILQKVSSRTPNDPIRL